MKTIYRVELTLEGTGYFKKEEEYYDGYEKAKRILRARYDNRKAELDKREVGGFNATRRAHANYDNDKDEYEIWWYETLYKGKIVPIDVI